jgi:hypothetical protein
MLSNMNTSSAITEADILQDVISPDEGDFSAEEKKPEEKKKESPKDLLKGLFGK